MNPIRPTWPVVVSCLLSAGFAARLPSAAAAGPPTGKGVPAPAAAEFDRYELGALFWERVRVRMKIRQARSKVVSLRKQREAVSVGVFTEQEVESALKRDSTWQKYEQMRRYYNQAIEEASARPLGT
jgi:hypothetical protein